MKLVLLASLFPLVLGHVFRQTTGWKPKCPKDQVPKKFLYDFEEFEAGDRVRTMENVKVSARKFVVEDSILVKKKALPMAFDSGNPTGGDTDLRTQKRGMVLIVSTDNDKDDPDDHEQGGMFIFKFDKPATINRIFLLDVEWGGTVKVFRQDGSKQKIPIPTVGDRGRVSIRVAETNVEKMVVEFEESAAVVLLDVTYCEIDSPEPSQEPSGTPTAQLSRSPSAMPSASPSAGPSASPSVGPSASPSAAFSASPSVSPSAAPSGSPSPSPSATPSAGPSASPSVTPSAGPSASPSAAPSVSPSSSPSASPSAFPSATPSASPSSAPSACPSASPSAAPSALPSASPSTAPSVGPSASPSTAPSATPSALPSAAPSATPSVSPSSAPSAGPSSSPSASPSTSPSSGPSSAPSATPSASPSAAPSAGPSMTPSFSPSSIPSSLPSATPSALPSGTPGGLCPSVTIEFGCAKCGQILECYVEPQVPSESFVLDYLSTGFCGGANSLCGNQKCNGQEGFVFKDADEYNSDAGRPQTCPVEGNDTIFRCFGGNSNGAALSNWVTYEVTVEDPACAAVSPSIACSSKCESGTCTCDYASSLCSNCP